MGLRDRITDFAINHMTDPSGSPNAARRATQAASVIADTVADHSTALAAGVSLAGAAVVAAEGALSNYVYPPNDPDAPYATFNG
jgi:hypothetical protein